MKLCKDCLWYTRPRFTETLIFRPGSEDMECAEPSLRMVDPVTGKQSMPYCADARSISQFGGGLGKCGPDGKLWKES